MGEGKVTVHQDKAIDDLVNGPQPVVPVNTTKPTTTKPDTKNKDLTKNQKPAEKKQADETDKKQADETGKKQADETGKKLVETTLHQQDSTQADTLSMPKKNTRYYKTTGYRVQVFAGGNSRNDKLKAERIGGELRALFPGETVYTHFYPPRWICRIGNYKTYEEAHKILHDVRQLGYSSATIVKGKIAVAY